MTSAGGRPLRILTVVGSMNVGGAETYISRISPRLRRHGIEVEICLLERKGPLLEALHRDGVVVHGTRLENRRPGLLGLLGGLAGALEDVRRLVRAGGFEVVHSYLFEADMVAIPAARAAGCGRIIESRRALHAWRHRPNLFEHLLETAGNAVADELIANSERVLADTEAAEWLLPRRRGVVYNGVDLDPSAPRAVPGSAGTLRLVTVGALAPRKGQEYAISALERVLAAGVDARLVLVGAGPDEAALRRAVEARSLTARVQFAGEQPPAPYLAGADVFVLPSRQEGFSNALVEAMAAGLPVVATDVGGNAEAVGGHDGGRLVSPENADALATAILELAAAPAGLAEIGARNRERVESRFTLDASAAALAAWYRRA